MRAERRAVGTAGLTAVGQAAVTAIQRYSPLLTGRLRRSYTHDVDPGGRWVEISTNVEYAPYQEFGTAYQSGTPHVRPGIESVIPQVGRLLASPMAAAGRGAVTGAAGAVGRAVRRLGGR